MFKSAIVIAAILGFSSLAFADEAVKPGGAAKAGRAVDDGKVKSAGKTDKSNRAADEAKK